MRNNDVGAVLRHGYEVWAESKGGSTDHWYEIMAPEIEFRSMANGEGGLDFTAPQMRLEDVGAYFAGLAAGWEMLHSIVDDIIVDGDRAVVLSRISWRNKATGALLNSPKADAWRFKDGLAVYFMEYYDTAAARRAAAGS
jgi:uncharacterized protein